MSSDPAVEALIADGSWNASPLGACGVRRMVRGRVAEGLVRLVREADASDEKINHWIGRWREACEELERVRIELARQEAVMVAADRVREAYEAMLEGRDVGRLPDFQRAALAADREREPVTDDRPLSRAPEGGRPDYVQRMRELAESVGERNERIRTLRDEWPVRVTDEMVERARLAGARWFAEHPDGASTDEDWREHYRSVFAAMDWR